MSNNIFAANQKYKLLSYGDSVVIGLSGGADSVCLAHKLWSLRETLSLSLTAAHVNHGIRGAEAQRDEAFCRAFCAAYRIPLEVLHADVPAQAAANKESTETCGRRIRYAFFQSLAADGEKIATAHNADDHAETIFMHIVRGAGGNGLCGIAPVRGNVIRPLLLNSREEIEQYCKRHSLDFVTDSTNAENIYTRNKIRNTVMPVLREINPSVRGAFIRMADHAAEDEAVLSELAEAAYTRLFHENAIPESALSELPRGVQRRVIRMALQQLGQKEISAVHTADVLHIAGTGRSVITAGGITVCSRAGMLLFFDGYELFQPFSVSIAETLCSESLRTQTLGYPYGTLKVQKILQKDLQNLNKGLLDNAVDCDKINSTLQLRSRREGDVFKSARGYTKTLKKLFNEAHIPPEQRNGVPVLADGENIIWIDGFGTSADYRVNGHSERIIIISRIMGVN